MLVDNCEIIEFQYYGIMWSIRIFWKLKLWECIFESLNFVHLLHGKSIIMGSKELKVMVIWNS